MSKVIISTQMPEQYEKFKSFLNGKATLMNAPMIEIKPVEPDSELQNVFLQLQKYNWLIFTSMRGVQGFFSLFEQFELDADFLKKIKIACIGEATGIELQKYGYQASYINEGNTSKEFANHLIDKVLNENDNILLPLGDKADTYLSETLNNFCTAQRIDVYQTIGTTSIEKEIVDLINADQYDLLVFTSPSAFENFIRLTGFQPTGEKLKIATIGNKTAESIEKQGFKVQLIPQKASLDGLATEIIEYLGQKQYN